MKIEITKERQVFWTDVKEYVKSSMGKEMSPLLRDSMLNFCWAAD